jgi:hypothetical protein
VSKNDTTEPHLTKQMGLCGVVLMAHLLMTHTCVVGIGVCYGALYSFACYTWTMLETVRRVRLVTGLVYVVTVAVGVLVFFHIYSVCKYTIIITYYSYSNTASMVSISKSTSSTKSLGLNLAILKLV